MQAIQDKRKPRTGSTRAVASEYLLTPILRCVQHDCSYIAYTINGHRYYICSERAKRGAQAVPCPLLKREELDTFILTTLRDELFTPARLRPPLEELAASAVNQAEEDRREAKRLRGEVATLDAELARFYQAIADGIPAANVAKPIEERHVRRAELEKRLAKLERTKATPQRIDLTEEAVACYVAAAREHFEHAGGHERKALLQECLNKIEVDGSAVTLWYTFAPPTPEIRVLLAPRTSQKRAPSACTFPSPDQTNLEKTSPRQRHRITAILFCRPKTGSDC